MDVLLVLLSVLSNCWTWMITDHSVSSLGLTSTCIVKVNLGECPPCYVEVESIQVTSGRGDDDAARRRLFALFAALRLTWLGAHRNAEGHLERFNFQSPVNRPSRPRCFILRGGFLFALLFFTCSWIMRAR